MFRAFLRPFQSPKLLNRTIMYKNMNSLVTKITSNPKNIGKFIIAGEISNMIKQDKENIENILMKVQDEGETAYIEVIQVLRETIPEVCKKYRECIQKQIQITQEAVEIGPLAEKWIDLIEYRSLARDCIHDLNIYQAVYKTVGKMVRDSPINTGNTPNLKDLGYVDREYKELEEIVEQELTKNRELELELLNMEKLSIIKDIHHDE